MYQFQTLTDAQVTARRHLLDRYAWIAQLSAVVPLLFLQLVFLVQRLDRWIKAREAADVEALGSPYKKHHRRLAAAASRGRWAWTDVRLWSWWASGVVEVGGEELGTRGELLGAGAWFVWLVTLCFLQTGDDYFHPTKRFGIVAASQLPLHYLLAMKSPYSPIQLLTGSAHETLNRIHQQLGRVITLMVWLHVIFYFNAWIQFGNVFQKLQLGYVICGVLASISITTLTTTAMAPIRRWSYRVFYTIHMVLATALFPLLYFHVDHVRPFLYETAIVYLASAALRWFHTRHYPATLDLLPGTSLLSIRVTAPEAPKRWHPAQHAYLSLPGLSLTRTLRSNPFTAASVPTGAATRDDPDAQTLRFVARVLDGNTAKLAQHLSGSGAAATPLKLAVEGPYGVRSHAARLRAADRVLLVAGGVGATFLLPLYRAYLAGCVAAPHRRRRVTLVWVARTWAEVAWGFEDSAGGVAAEGLAERARVCLTRGEEEVGERGAAVARMGRYVGDEPALGEAGSDAGLSADDDEAGSIEMQEQKTLMSDDEKTAGGSGGGAAAAGVPVYAGRPDFARLVDRTFGYGELENVAVVVCGPKSLGKSVRAEVERWVRRGRTVWFWEERFGL